MAQPRSRKSKQAELPAVDADAVEATQAGMITMDETVRPTAATATQGAEMMTAETAAETPATPAPATETPATETPATAPRAMESTPAEIPTTESNAALAAEVKTLRGELASQMNWVFGAISLAGVALLAALTSPMWSAKMVANDINSVRTLALASAYLGRVAETSRPFAAELALVRRSMPNDKQVASIVDVIVPLAAASTPTVTELETMLESMASDVFVGKVVGNNDTWVNSSVTRLASLARLESLATTVAPKYTGEEVALVHEAEVLVSRGDLKGAVSRLDKLTGHAAETASAWVATAKQRLLLDEKVAELSALALQRASQPARFVLP